MPHAFDCVYPPGQPNMELIERSKHSKAGRQARKYGGTAAAARLRVRMRVYTRTARGLGMWLILVMIMLTQRRHDDVPVTYY